MSISKNLMKIRPLLRGGNGGLSEDVAIHANADHWSVADSGSVVGAGVGNL